MGWLALSVVLVEAAGMLAEATDEAAGLVGALVGLADGLEPMTEIVLVAAGVAVDPPQFHQPPEAVTVTVRVSSTTLVTMYLLSSRGVAKTIGVRRVIARVRFFILNQSIAQLGFTDLAIRKCFDTGVQHL